MTPSDDFKLLDILNPFPVFESLTNNQLSKLFEDSKIISLYHKEVLFNFDESAEFLYFIISGAFKLVRPAAAGESSIIQFSRSGDIIGALILNQKNSVYPISAISIGSSKVFKIPKKNFLNEWQTNIKVFAYIQDQIKTRMLNLQYQKTLNRAPLQAKIAYLLVQLTFEKNAILSGIPQPISIPLTRKEIADAVDSTVESIIRIMSDWAKKKYISTDRQNIILLKPEKIQEISLIGF